MVAQPLNLLGLARGNPSGSSVPGTALEVLYLSAASREELSAPWWLLVLEGELILDLPHGDFRVLKTGDSLHLSAGLRLDWQPLEAAVVLRQRG